MPSLQKNSSFTNTYKLSCIIGASIFNGIKRGLEKSTIAKSSMFDRLTYPRVSSPKKDLKRSNLNVGLGLESRLTHSNPIVRCSLFLSFLLSD